MKRRYTPRPEREPETWQERERAREQRARNMERALRAHELRTGNRTKSGLVTVWWSK